MMTLKQRLASDELVRVMGVGRILHPNLVRIVGVHGGYHGLWIDLEHCGNGTEQVEIACGVARGVGLDVFCRLAPTDYASVTRCLEAGASGVMAAQIRTPEEAEQFVQWAKFAPRGQRGLNVGGWDADYARLSITQFMERSNRESFVSIQIETVEAVENVDAIASIDGVDLLFVGPSDLSQALGVPGEFLHGKCLAALDAVATACERHGKRWGAVAANPEHARCMIDRGLGMLSPSNDVKIVNAGLKAIETEYGAFFDRPIG
jgi:4-hydroxy-2-oxoheptanedioate aldolase